MDTINFNFHKEIKKGEGSDPYSAHLLRFQGSIPHIGEFQSMEVSTYRDGKRKHTIGLQTFHLMPQGSSTLVTFQLNDMRHKVIKHGYVLDVTLRFKS